MSEKAGLSVKKSDNKGKDSASVKSKAELSQSMDINSPVEQVLHLQRTIGNRAVTRLIQSGVLQAKLKIGQPGDVYEQEAEQVAEQVMRMSEEPLVNSHWSLARKEEGLVQAKGDCGQSSDISSCVESHINALKGKGQPLSQTTRDFFEPRFGADFSHVRVHSSPDAAAIATEINAKAFTTGNDIFFNTGQYSPGTSGGKNLLAHELTHVLQQHAGVSFLQQQAIPTPADDRTDAAGEIDNQIALINGAIEKLKERESDDETNEFTEHINNLNIALRELQLIKSTRTPSEMSQISNQFESVKQQIPGASSAALLLQRKAIISSTTDSDRFERKVNPYANNIAMRMLDNTQPTHRPSPIASVGKRIQREAATLTLVGGGIAAGPPGWVVLACVAVGVAVIGGVYLATRPREVETTEEQAEPRVVPREVPRTCATQFPAARTCSSLPGSFIYSNPQAALAALKISTGRYSLRLVSPQVSTSGPCPGVGMHYGVKEGGVYVASISCCPCCIDSPGGPVMTTRCQII